LFETGSDELKLMEQKVYVASGRFIIEAGKPPVVEYVITFGLFSPISISRDLCPLKVFSFHYPPRV
jgi:hypothetical protein